MARKTLQFVTAVIGLLTIALGSVSLVYGTGNPLYAPATLPDSSTLDSNLRFFGGMGAGLGLLLLWIVPAIEKRTTLFRGVWLCAFLGGVGRAISMAVVGLPPMPIVVFTAIEVIGAPLFVYWQELVARSRRPVAS